MRSNDCRRFRANNPARNVRLGLSLLQSCQSYSIYWIDLVPFFIADMPPARGRAMHPGYNRASFFLPERHA